jgi:hypothetical protein
MLGWLACVVYSTIPSFWFMVHPLAERWRSRQGSPFRVLVPAWVGMWIGMGCLTGPWRHVRIYATAWTWLPAVALFAVGIFLYSQSGAHFSSPSRVSGAFVRNAGVEPRHGAGGLLESDRFCRHHGSCDDSHGGGGIGEAIWDRVQSLPARGSGSAAENAPMTCPIFNLRRVCNTVVYKLHKTTFEAAAQSSSMQSV